MLQYLLHGFSHGFSIGYKGPPLAHCPPNLSSARAHPEVITSYINNECSAGHTAGPFSSPPFLCFNTNPLGAVPKKQTGKWRLILHLSHPQGHSVNDGIPVDEFSLRYITIDSATDAIMSLGKGCHLAKVDIKAAFRLCPVQATDYPLLGFKWDNKFYYDRVLPFGLRSAPYIFNCLAEALCWTLIHNHSIPYVMHYLDDYLTLAQSLSDCASNLHTIKAVFAHLGVPLAEEKVEGPSTTISFLGIILDSVQLEARLPPDKLTRIKQDLHSWSTKEVASKRELLSLIGLLSFAAKVVPPGRTFLRRMIDLASSQPTLTSTLTLGDNFRKDLMWWRAFAQQWNGRSFFLSPKWIPSTSLQLFTDSSGTIGYGAYYQDHWFQGKWKHGEFNQSIQWKELYPIVLAAATWGHHWSSKRILFLSDNQAVVSILQSGTSRSPEIMSLVRCLHLCAAKHNFSHTAKHVPGVSNSIADALSRFNMQVFRQLAPEADLLPTTPACLPLIPI